MAEYIDRKALGIGKCNPDVFENKGYAEGWNSAIEIIENAPATDVVEVVRCKDCKHWENDKDYSQKPWCTFWTLDSTLFHTDPDDFCSYGERKTK